MTYPGLLTVAWVRSFPPGADKVRGLKYQVVENESVIRIKSFHCENS
jgi:hypothetical protein